MRSARGRTASRGGGVSYKCTDRYRRAPNQVERCADRDIVVERCADSDSVVERCADSDSVVERCADSDSVVERCADSDSVVERCAVSDGIVVGRCTAFCPAKELKLRVRERLLSRYEAGGEGLRPVKEYSRPAAGQAAPSSDTVRTPDTLLDCAKYLVREVLVPRLMAKEKLLDLYEFVFDRLRAIRQDLVVQRVTDTTSMVILAICVR